MRVQVMYMYFFMYFFSPNLAVDAGGSVDTGEHLLAIKEEESGESAGVAGEENGDECKAVEELEGSGMDGGDGGVAAVAGQDGGVSLTHDMATEGAQGEQSSKQQVLQEMYEPALDAAGAISEASEAPAAPEAALHEAPETALDAAAAAVPMAGGGVGVLYPDAVAPPLEDAHVSLVGECHDLGGGGVDVEMGEAGGVGEEASEEASGDKASEVALGQGGGVSEVGANVQVGAEIDLDMSDFTWDETDGSLF